MHPREIEGIYDAVKRYLDGEAIPHESLRIIVGRLFELEQQARAELTELEQEYDELFNQKNGNA